MIPIFLFLLTIVLAMPYGGEAADVHLQWNWDAPSYPPRGYIIERKFGAFGSYAEIGYSTVTEWTDTDIPMTDRVPIYWQVRAVNELGITDPSNELSLNLGDVPQNIRVIIETLGPSEPASRMSAHVRVRKKGNAY